MSGFIINQITKEGYSIENLSIQIEQLTSKPVLATMPYIENFSFEEYFKNFKKNTNLSNLGFKDF
jgi:cobyric acid synthase